MCSRACRPSLPPLPAGAPNNRLGFAKWLVDPENPLLARVTVNRFWQMYFGTGIVKTVEDFGAQGEWPSHPELLDWLATEFVRTGWDVKAHAEADRDQRDLPAIVEGDAGAGAARSGEPAAGARAALPPAGRDDPRPGAGRRRAAGGEDRRAVGEAVSAGRACGKSWPCRTWITSRARAPDLYRRSLYTFWKRTVAPPMMINFDAAERESCVVRETRTNTPLQALNLMNDVTFRGSRALPRAAHDEGRRRDAGRAAALRIPAGHWARAVAGGSSRSCATACNSTWIISHGKHGEPTRS